MPRKALSRDLALLCLAAALVGEARGEDVRAILIVDTSSSVPAPCDAVELLTRGVLAARGGVHSTLTLFSLGSPESGNEPIRIHTFALPATGRVLEGHGKVRQDRGALPGKVAEQCKTIAENPVSPILLAVKAGLSQLRDGGCGTSVRCLLIVRSDGEENVERAVRLALDGRQPLPARLVHSLDNSGVEVTICGMAETRGGKVEQTGELRPLTGIRDSQRDDRLRSVWTQLFKATDHLRLTGFCEEPVVGAIRLEGKGSDRAEE